MPAREPVYEAGEAVEDAYFPVDAVISIVADMSDGRVVEVATIGREGMVGVGLVLDATVADHRIFVQIPGRALRLPAGALTKVVRDQDGVRRLLYRYVRALVAQISRSAACNRVHSINERTARWLLMSHDRVGQDEFPLTQEFLGQMLGIARPRVSTAAARLQRAGLIQYSRGRITVVDRAGLEAASCDCYRAIADEYERLLG